MTIFGKWSSPTSGITGIEVQRNSVLVTANAQKINFTWQVSVTNILWIPTVNVLWGPWTLRFIDLIDVPVSYAGAAWFLVRVNATEDWLEFVDPGSIPLWLNVKCIYDDWNPNTLAITPTKAGDLYYNNLTGEMWIAINSTTSWWKMLEYVLPINFWGGTGVGVVTLPTIVTSVMPIGNITPTVVWELCFYTDWTDFKLYHATGLSNADRTEIWFTQFAPLVMLPGTYVNTRFMLWVGDPFWVIDPVPYGPGIMYRDAINGNLWINVTLAINGRIQINYLM